MRLILTLLILLPTLLPAQNWYTQGGNNGRNGQSPYSGPQEAEVLWTNAGLPASAWGGATYIEGDRYVTYRYSSTILGTSCRLVIGDLLTGEDLFTFIPHPNSVMLPLGIAKNTLYAVDYRTQSGDTLYAIDLTTFDVLWKTPPICWNGFTSGVQFTCDGDPIVNGVVPQRSVMRLDRRTGAIVWASNHFTTINGSNGTCMVGQRIYTWEGSIFDPKHVRAIDAETGATLFDSPALPGDGDQEIRLTAGPDSTVYACRDGGALYALQDTGTGFALRWTYEFTGAQPGAYSNFAVHPRDGHVYIVDGGYVVRLDHASGEVLGLSDDALPGYAALMAIDAGGTLYVATSGQGADGKYVAYAPTLDTVRWTFAAPTNYYSAPAIGRDGILLVSGSGTAVRALQTPAPPRAPVAAFRPSRYRIDAGESVDFVNWSSYDPTELVWSFPGGEPASATGAVPPPVLYSEPGAYSVSLIAVNAQGVDTLLLDCLIDVLPSSAVATPGPEGRLELYPNPANNQLTLKALEHAGGLRISSAAGKIFFDGMLKPGEDYTIFVTNWPAGAYTVQIRTERDFFASPLIIAR
jgi:outer membrane protein assembly factor BamB